MVKPSDLLLINHCMDLVRTGVRSFGRQFDFHDVIYHNRRRNVDFTTIGRSKRTWKYEFQSKQELQEILTVCIRWRNHYRLWRICSYFQSFWVSESKKIRTGSDLLLNISLASRSLFILFNDWPPASDILSNKSPQAQIYFLIKNSCITLNQLNTSKYFGCKSIGKNRLWSIKNSCITLNQLNIQIFWM